MRHVAGKKSESRSRKCPTTTTDLKQGDVNIINIQEGYYLPKIDTTSPIYHQEQYIHNVGGESSRVESDSILINKTTTTDRKSVV